MHGARSMMTTTLFLIVGCKGGTVETHAPSPITSADAGPSLVATSPTTSSKGAKGPRSVKTCETLKTKLLGAKGAPALSTYTSAPCKSLAQKHAALVAQAAKKPANVDADTVALANEAFRCVAGNDGAWASTFDALHATHEAGASSDGVEGRLVLVRVDASGKRVAAVAPASVEDYPPATAKSSVASGDNFGIKMFDHVSKVDALVVFDWNADGAPEAFLGISEAKPEAGARVRGRVWTLNISQIVEYEPARALAPESVVDVDDDRLPDLLFTLPFAAEVTNEVGQYPQTGPTLLAHAKTDGTFAVDDATAKDVASCACPSSPAPFSLPAEPDAALDAVACARVWGVEPSEIESVAKKACQGKSDGSPCGLGALHEFAKASPPVHLP